MTQAPQFDVFLSHNSRDRSIVREVATALRHRGLRPWLVEDELLPGEPWQRSIERALRRIKTIAVLIGRDGLGLWEQLELEAVLERSVNDGTPVIPVLLPGAPQKPSLPIFLQNTNFIDLRQGLSHDALDRLQWGITGKRPTTRMIERDKEEIDLFLCFRANDRSAVQQIALELGRNQIRCWPNDWSISPDDSWRELLSHHMQRINAVGVFAADDDGPWIDEQVESFIWELIEADHLVIPVILPTAKLDPKFPVYLRRRQIVDFRKSLPNPVSQLVSMISINRHGQKGSFDG